MTLPLRDVLAAIMRDIDVASVRADVNRAHWRHIYDETELLKEFSPSRIRILEANLSLPLALDEITEAKEEDYGITTEQLSAVLPEGMSKAQRLERAKQLRARLLERGEHQLLSKRLKPNIRRVVEAEMEDVDPHALRLERIDRIQQEFLSRPAVDREARFFYKATELEKIDPEHVVRFNFTLAID